MSHDFLDQYMCLIIAHHIALSFIHSFLSCFMTESIAGEDEGDGSDGDGFK